MEIFKNKIDYNDIDIILKNYNFGKQNTKIISYHDKLIKNIINLKEIFYCDLSNKILIDTILKYVNVEKDEIIYSLHYIKYESGYYAKKHLDIKSNKTYLIMLNDNFEGGELYVNNELVNFKKGDVVNFNGQIEEHEVKEITSGCREIMAVWISKKVKNII
jgi:predicted 2-oxoglutarate/Fe(II)-dependent dioxygenase YbiX